MEQPADDGASGTTTSPDPPLTATAVIPRHVVYRTFVRETIAVDLSTGQYHRLDPVNGRLLEALDKASGSLREAAAAIASELGRPFEETAHELRQLCGELGASGLVELNLAPK
jgi:hypothetical protein